MNHKKLKPSIFIFLSAIILQNTAQASDTCQAKLESNKISITIQSNSKTITLSGTYTINSRGTFGIFKISEKFTSTNRFYNIATKECTTLTAVEDVTGKLIFMNPELIKKEEGCPLNSSDLICEIEKQPP